MMQTLIADWSIWTPINYFNFRFIPVPYQGLFVGVFTFLFNIVFSEIAYENDQMESDEEDSNDDALVK